MRVAVELRGLPEPNFAVDIGANVGGSLVVPPITTPAGLSRLCQSQPTLGVIPGKYLWSCWMFICIYRWCLCVEVDEGEFTKECFDWFALAWVEQKKRINIGSQPAGTWFVIFQCS